jgi:hypothetical protein
MEEPHRRDRRHSGGNVKPLVGFPRVDPARQRTPTAYICPTVERGAWDRSMARACFVILALWDRSYARWGRTSPLRSSGKFTPRTNGHLAYVSGITSLLGWLPLYNFRWG